MTRTSHVTVDTILLEDQLNFSLPNFGLDLCFRFTALINKRTVLQLLGAVARRD
jgi:hypothetical protein